MKRGLLRSLGVGLAFLISSYAHGVGAAPALDTVVNPTAQPPLASDLVVVSAVYAPAGKVEFVELHNISGGAVDVTGWRVTFSIASSGSVQTLTLPVGYMLVDGYISLVNSQTSGNYFSFTSALPVGAVLSSIVISNSADEVIHTTKDMDKVTTFTSRWWSRETSGLLGIFDQDFTAHTADAVINHTPLYVRPLAPPTMRIVEVYPHASTCAPGDAGVLCGDYVKVFVPSSETNLSSFRLRSDSSSRVSTSANTFSIPEPNAEGYTMIRLRDDGQPMELNLSGYVWIEDYTGATPYSVVKYTATASEQGYGYALVDGEQWQWTSTPKPLSANLLTTPVEEVADCPAGQYRSPETNRCRKIEEAVNALAVCPEGQERNPATNRCRSKVAVATTTLTQCAEGQERNPATNRCRTIASAVAELLPCDEGYERNPATNRCRKVLAAATTNTPPTVAQAVEQAKGSNWNAWTWALVAVGAAGAIGYGMYEWRSELGVVGQKIAAKFGKK